MDPRFQAKDVGGVRGIVLWTDPAGDFYSCPGKGLIIQIAHNWTCIFPNDPVEWNLTDAPFPGVESIRDNGVSSV